MKKSVFLIMLGIIILCTTCISFANSDVPYDEMLEPGEVMQDFENDEAVEAKRENSNLNGASEEILGTMSRKDERIKVLSQKYNDTTLGTVAYGLEVVRFYSTPVLFVFLVMGAFNFFIIGNKKLDKKEQGFGWITTCLIGWVVF